MSEWILLILSLHVALTVAYYEVADSDGRLAYLTTYEEQLHARHRRAISGILLPTAFSQEEADVITSQHLLYRLNAAAANMMYMTWDDALAQLAQGLSDTCNFDHDNTAFENGSFVGQNLALVPGSFDEAAVVELWHDEISIYDFQTNTCQEGEQCGHYTQVVWSGSNKVGCGKTFCPTVTGTTLTDMWFYVCDYSPPGNYPWHPFLPTTYEPCELCNLSPGTECIQNQCRPCDPFENANCRAFDPALCQQDINQCCASWDAALCEPNNEYYNFMALSCGLTCGSYVCLFP